MISDERILYLASPSNDAFSYMDRMNEGFKMFKMYYTNMSFVMKYFSFMKNVAYDVVRVFNCGNLYSIYILAAMQSHYCNKSIQKYGWRMIRSLKQKNDAEAPLQLLLVTFNRTLPVFSDSYSTIENALSAISISSKGDVQLL